MFVKCTFKVFKSTPPLNCKRCSPIFFPIIFSCFTLHALVLDSFGIHLCILHFIFLHRVTIFLTHFICPFAYSLMCNNFYHLIYFSMFSVARLRLAAQFYYNCAVFSVSQHWIGHVSMPHLS